ncbi:MULTISPECIES: phage tail spike protein [Bacillus cereus group]|nr:MULTISPECIES: phage tail spike protein [Bacillus cereus group]ANT40251.1 minor structural protein [Bacillus phage PfNC7401]BAL21485.1 phage minor structural protein [Bacillus cereus NC7401]MBE7112102.1 peptidase S74 [Bacillus paranthracis]MDX5824223.1 phage tail spike protein [Bacillus cereus group sp. BfR-BA-02490]MDX5857859.1 phage tail spike protein [Bacillus cereus group sp. BfR-BA-01363]
MKKVSGDLHIVDFKTKQIIATIQPADYFDDLRHWEIKDNVDILDFKLLEDSPFLDYIQQKNLILKETNPGVITPYVITSIEKDSENHNVTIYASGEWILLDKEVPLTPQEIKSWSAEQYLKFATSHTDWEVGFIEAIGKRSFKIEKPMSPLQFIQQIATLFDNIEIQYRIEIGTGKPRRFIDLVKKRGRETNKEVTLGKDLVGIKRIENSENIITALFPYYIGQDADGNDKLITIESVNNGSQYIVDDAAFQRWNVNGKHLFGFYTPESEKDELTPSRLLTLAKMELKKRVSAIVTYEVNSVDISSVFGYEHEDVREGDTIRIIDEGMTPTLYLEARAIVGDNSYKDKHQNKHKFGNYVEIVNQDEALRRLYQKMLSMINDKVSKEWFAALEEKANDTAKKANEAVEESKTAKDLATATKDYMDQNMVDIIESVSPPIAGLKPNKTLWRDISGGKPGILKIWTGTVWDVVVPDVEEVKRDLELTNESMKSKISEKQMQDYLGGLGSTNILFNSAFEDREINPSSGVIISRTPSLSKWSVTATAGTAVTPTTSKRHDGYNSVQIQATGLTGNVLTGISQMTPVTSNSGKVVLSAWIFTNSKDGLDQDGYLEIKFRNGLTVVATTNVTLKDKLTDGVWTFISVTADVPSSAVTHAEACIGINKNGLIWASQPQFQQGENPSSFMENPKDYANYDQLVGEIAKKVATSEFDSKVSTIETSINQQSDRINLKAEKNDVYNKTDSDRRFGSKAIVDNHTSQLSLMSDEINLRVKNNEIASTFNQTAQSVLIQASKIYLDGYIEAKHLKAQTLQGVTIQTAPAGSGANHIRLNAQNLTVYGGGRSRGYLGFIERTDGNIQSALILGNDYETTGTLNGSLVIDQTTINSNVFTNSVASIGIATGRNGNDVVKSSYINFYRYDGAMQINSIGDMSLTNTNGNISLTASSTGGTTGFITLSSSKDINLTAKRGYFNFYTSDNKSFPAMTIKDLAPTAQGDVDFTFANQIMFRMARHPDYVGEGLQIKSTTGDAFRDIKLRTLRATENISAAGRMWAQEFIPSSSRTLKTNIEDLPFSALDKINSVNIKQYHFIRDVERFESGESITLPINYGMIAEDSDDVFTTPQKDAVTLYSSVAISIQAIQEVDFKVKNLQFDHGMLKQEVVTLKEQLEAEKLEKVSMKAEIDELKVLVQQLINKKPEQP